MDQDYIEKEHKNDTEVLMNLDKKIKIVGDSKYFTNMIVEVCGINNIPLPIIRNCEQLLINLLFHKKRKALCLENNPRYRTTRFYS